MTTRVKQERHVAGGPGLKLVGTERWWGGAYCGVCGNRDANSEFSPLVPQRVRWWDTDDGWKSGVLCVGCGEDAADRGPRPDDYAVVTREREAVPAPELRPGMFVALAQDARVVRILTKVQRDGDVWRLTFNEGAPERLMANERLWVAVDLQADKFDVVDEMHAGDDDGAHVEEGGVDG